MSKVRRIYVEKKDAYAVKAKDLKKQFKDYLGIKADNVRVLTRYDMEGVSIPTTKRRLQSSQSHRSMSYMKNHSL